MIGFVLGTGEGKAILEGVNKFTSDIVVTTATEYGAKLLENFNTKYISDSPLDLEGFKNLIKDYNIKIFVDASHPYASEVSKTVIKACDDMEIEYVRYERLGYFDKNHLQDIIRIEDYDSLKGALEGIEGNILNTTGSNNALKINSLNLKNRVIHRVLPLPNVLKKMIDGGIDLEDIIAIKGPFGLELNRGIIKEYDIKAIITKDSGDEGSVREKVEAILEKGGKVILIEKPRISYPKVFTKIEEVVEYLKDKKL